MDVGTVVASISASAAAGGLIFNAYQRHRDSKIDRGTFWLELEKMFQRYDPLYMHLRFNGGDWCCQDRVGPSSPEEIAQLCDYLGLFEHCNILLEQKIIDFQTFESIYKTRVIGLLSNKIIRENELKDRKKWSTFYQLLNKLDLLDSSGIIIEHDNWRDWIESRNW